MEREDVKTAAAILGVTTLLFTILTVLVSVPLILNQYISCESYRSLGGADVRMVAGTCMVNTGRKWVTLDSYVNLTSIDLIESTK